MGEIVQQKVKVKKLARYPNLLIEIPQDLVNEFNIKQDDVAGVFIEKEKNNVKIIYEFKRGK